MADSYFVYIGGAVIGTVKIAEGARKIMSIDDACDYASAQLGNDDWVGDVQWNVPSPISAAKAALDMCISYEQGCLKRNRPIRENLTAKPGATYIGPDGKLLYLGEGKVEVTIFPQRPNLSRYVPKLDCGPGSR